ncbi:MAG TPA: substrate-binding domain-containing protein, partial [Anaeromyxobacteraceae bacterium]|nr:substrate-binding domain-containing protein [Anaeromyxobacteraceae bacterium]
MTARRWTTGLALAAVGLAAAGCQGLVDEVVGGKRHDAKTIHVTLIGKSSANPVFLSARVGAEAAAKDLSEKHRKLDVQVDWRTPRTEDPRAQAERIRAAVDDGTDAIAVSCSDEAILTAAIDEAVARGVPVMTFDSDAPRSRRFAFYGPNDLEIGESVMNELAALLGKKGKVAILAGNPSAPNLQRRVEGVRRAAARHPGIEVVGVFTHAETAEEATAKVLEVNRANPDLAGWAMVGGWPLFGPGLLDAIDPRKVKVVAVDALPSQFPYVEKGIAPVLLAQPTFKWGKVAVEKVVDKVGLGKDVPAMNEMKLIRVSKENLGGWARQLKAWGYPDVPERYLTYEA